MAEELDLKVEITLPSGRKAQILKGKVKHMRKAAAAAREQKDLTLITQLYLAQTVKIDGELLKADDWDEMELDDFTAIQEAVEGSGSIDPLQVLLASK